MMGIYYGAVDRSNKLKFWSPSKYSNKFPGIFHPDNPFPQMVVMMNALGNYFDIENDGDWEGPLYNSEYKDITDEVYEKLLKFYPESNMKEE